MNAYVKVPAYQLVSNDIIESHDDLAHSIEAVSLSGDQRRVTVNVHKSNGETYSVEFDFGHEVSVLA